MVWLQGAGTFALPAVPRRPHKTRLTRRWSCPTTRVCAMPRLQTLSRRDHSRGGSFTRKVSTL